ncbi:Sodium/calcium exchanger protein-domain-containing protein [Xylariaceae sp. FL0804]|nr:Sodium/calcium exchanger protein-domain-containing protein [Xylariaceae sp. FL0804]
MGESVVNLYSIRNQAQKLSRTDSTGSAAFNPFRHISYKKQHGRANTLDAVEQGRAMEGGDTPLTQSRTAPDSFQSPLPMSRDGQRADGAAGQDDEHFDSQATTAVPNRRPSKDGALSPGEKTDSPVEEEDKVHGKPQFTLKNQLQRTLLSSWINILLLAAPVGIAAWQVPSIPGQATFAINFIAIIPLAALLAYSTEQIALRTGEVWGGLINATFGNAVELIVAIIALVDGQVTVVQTSLVGSILSNLLLVLGMCFFFGGINRLEQFFNTTVAQTAASLLALAVASLIVPTVFSLAPSFSTTDGITNNSIPAYAVPQLSHGVAVILLVVYASYLFFQLRTHSSVFNEESQKVAKTNIFKSPDSVPDNPVASGVARAGASNAGIRNRNGDMNRVMQTPEEAEALRVEDEGPEEPELSYIVAFVTLAAATVVIALCSEGMVSGIDAIAEEGVSKEFIGLILIPIVGNACEHATAVTVAVKDKMDLAIGVAIGSSMQVALFLIPLLVVIAWGMGNTEMTLAFDTFQVVILFVSVLLVNYLIGDGKSHWLEGAQLICLYLIIAVCAWYGQTY